MWDTLDISHAKQLPKTTKCSQQNIEEINYTITHGGIIVFPTDTVYGIGCNPYDESAVQRIYRIKQRQQKKPLPVLAFSTDELEKIAVLDSRAQKIAKRFWPGQVTMILWIKDVRLKRSLRIQDKIAVRVPDGSCIRSILKRCRLLVGTSANPSGTRSFVDPKDCVKSIRGYDIFVDGGIIDGGKESTIIDLTEKHVKVIREGIITEKEIVESI